jgi:hypothetical protein
MRAIRIRAVANGFIAVEDNLTSENALGLPKPELNVFANIEDLHDWIDYNLDESAEQAGPVGFSGILMGATADDFAKQQVRTGTDSDPYGLRQSQPENSQQSEPILSPREAGKLCYIGMPGCACGTGIPTKNG